LIERVKVLIKFCIDLMIKGREVGVGFKQ